MDKFKPTKAKGKARGKSKNHLGKNVINRNIDTDGVTYSFLREFLENREAARMSYVEGWQEVGMMSSLEFGQLFHACFEATARNHNQLPNVDRVVKDTIKFRDSLSPLDKEGMKDIKILGEIVKMMYPIYFDFWKKNKGIEFAGNAEYIAQEEPFEVQHTFPVFYQTPDGFTESTHRIILRGRFDAILRINGRIWLMENKTKSQIDHEGLTAYLSQDMQTMMYCQAIYLKYGEYPEGVLYNVVKRPGHRFGVKDTAQSYLQRIQDSVVQEPQDYFMRWHVSIGEAELQQWVTRTLDKVLYQVWKWWNSIKNDPFQPWSSPEHFHNPESAYTRFGRSRYFNYYTRNTTHGLRKILRKR